MSSHVVIYSPLFLKGEDLMKKFFALLLALVMVMSLVACGGKEEAPAAKEETKTEAPAADSGEKTLKLALSNSFLENGWRQEMIAVAELMLYSTV